MIALEASQDLAPEDRDPRHGLIASQYFKFTSTLHSLECDGISLPPYLIDLENSGLCCVWVVLYICSCTLHPWISFCLLVYSSRPFSQKVKDVTEQRGIVTKTNNNRW